MSIAKHKKNNEGYNLAMDILEAFPPKYWIKFKYVNMPYILLDTSFEEFKMMYQVMELAQMGTENDEEGFVELADVLRMQNPFAYARFVLRKRQLNKQKKTVYQYRKYMMIKTSDLDTAIKFNFDPRRYCKSGTDVYKFVPNLPVIYEDHVVLVAQVLSLKEDDHDKTIECKLDNEFYIEYIALFDDTDDDEN